MDKEQKNELDKVEVAPAAAVWEKKNGKYKLKDNITFVGKIDKEFASGVVGFNKRGTNNQFVNDFAKLPSETKNKVADLFLNKNKKVAYLIKADKPTKPKVKTKPKKQTKPKKTQS
ncbi:MAG: hypothetical protein RSB20_00675 [Clostridia bacterium]